MPFSSSILDFLGEGLAADRPVSIPINPAACGLYFATDTLELSVWDSVTTSWLALGTAGSVGTVTEVIVGAGLTGFPTDITNVGTIILAQIAGNELLGNPGTVAATPVGVHIGTGLSLSAGGTLFASSGSGTVTQINTSGAGISGGPITTTGTLEVEWNAGTVNTLGTGLNLSSGTLTPNWQDGTVTTIGSGVTVTSGTLSATGSGGTVTEVVAGSGLAGGTITNAGTVSLGTIAAGDLMGNPGAAGAVPSGVAVGSGLSLSASGTLTASGSGGTVTQVIAGSGLAGGTITTTGTISLGTIAAGDILGNPGTAAAVPSGVAIGSGLSLSSSGTLTASGSGGSVTDVVAGAGLTTALGSTNGSITATGTVYSIENINAQTGTTYTVANSDQAKLITVSNTAAVAVTLPQAGASSLFLANWYADFENINTGLVTITPTTSTVDGAASLALRDNQGVRIVSDGTNYFTHRGMGLWNTTAVSAIGSGVTVSSGTLSATGSGGSVTSVTTSGAGISASPATITGAGTLSVEWNGGTVNTLGTGLNLSSGTLTPNWEAGVVTTIGNNLTLNSGTISAVLPSGTINKLNGTFTSNGTLGTVIAGGLIIGASLQETAGHNVAVELGITTTGAEIFPATTVTASSILPLTAANLLLQAWTANQPVYISSGSWGSASITANLWYVS